MFLPNKWASRLLKMTIHFADFRICFTGRIGAPWFGEEESTPRAWDSQLWRVCLSASLSDSVVSQHRLPVSGLHWFPRFIFLVWPLLFASSFAGWGGCWCPSLLCVYHLEAGVQFPKLKIAPSDLVQVRESLLVTTYYKPSLFTTRGNSLTS